MVSLSSRVASTSAAVVLFCSTVFAQEAPRSADDYFFVPPTVSGEAQKAIGQFSRSARNALVAPEPTDLAGWKALNEAMEQQTNNKPLYAQYNPFIEKIKLGGVSALDVRPRHWKENGKVVLYLHGGAYTTGSANTSLVGAVPLADKSGLRVIVVDYTLAPKARWPQITDEVINAYQAVLDMGYAPEDIAFYGDSAGGGLLGGALLKARDAGMPMPAGAVFWSPWSDISETGDSYHTLKDAEPTYTYANVLGKSAAAYADPVDHVKPYVSPVYGDFTKGFPKSFIQVGTKELFLSNAVRLYQAMDIAGVPVVIDVYEGMPHVFQLTMPDTPESQRAIEKSALFLKDALGLERHATPKAAAAVAPEPQAKSEPPKK
ncbi:alpha/beta hydrolase fold domain-containing protein [Pseudovibrio flavus]|uniref:alpha/beta hydrolase fold domain-containing protein n=1 Tax=Pseudovibrio flavus TaxID=2529854 RepID=UPI00211CADD5|nr:alpha/beta hydrolase [Pseudovibrio flavus]